MADGIRVTARDEKTGEEISDVIWDDYILICAGSCHLAHVASHANGTVVLTIEGLKAAKP